MNIAMFFTGSRLFLAPLFAYFFIAGFRQQSPILLWIAVGCVVLLELSDMFDGMIARARKEVTDFGKLFDPVADSVSRQTVFLSFLVAGIIPLWMCLVFLYRDAFIQLLRMICASTGIVLAARKSGKFKAVIQAIATFAVLTAVLANMHFPGLLPPSFTGKNVGFWAVFVAAMITVLSFFDYIIPNWPSIAKMLQRK
jgi:CDP-diacylglycerol---glycerol-3-phosphate 3-phosphatidyltransferase